MPVTRFNLSHKVLFLVIFLSVQFVLLSGLAIAFYSENYVFFQDPLSGLGYTHVNGEENFISSVLFNISMFGLGVGSIIFFLSLTQFFKFTLLEQWSGISSAILGTVSGLVTMCGAALTPGDINFDMHVMFAPITFLFGMIAFSLFGIAAVSSIKFDNRYGFIAFGYTGIASLSIIIMLIGPAYSTPTGLFLQTAFQKIIIYAECIVLIAVAWGSSKFIRLEISQ